MKPQEVLNPKITALEKAKGLLNLNNKEHKLQYYSIFWEIHRLEQAVIELTKLYYDRQTI